MLPQEKVWEILARMSTGLSEEKEKEDKYDENKTQKEKVKSNR
jgi:hypothetical protein